MNGVFDFIPTYCPNCGGDLHVNDDEYSRMDFFAGATFTCDCGFHFCYTGEVNVDEEADESES